MLRVKSYHQEMIWKHFLYLFMRRLLAGAPKEKALSQLKVNETGAIYSCPITTDLTDCTRVDLITSSKQVCTCNSPVMLCLILMLSSGLNDQFAHFINIQMILMCFSNERKIVCEKSPFYYSEYVQFNPRLSKWKKVYIY